jgi:acyl-homoserine-lactone acylase
MSLRKFSLSLLTASVVLAGCGKDSSKATDYIEIPDKTPPASSDGTAAQGPLTKADYPVPAQITRLEELGVLRPAASTTGKTSNTNAAVSNGMLTADITRTDYGVPHIKANTLQEVAFGAGYAYAEDNHCLLIDQITKAKGERSLYFGPHVDGSAPNQFGITDFGPGDFLNIISDFSFKATLAMETAAEKYDMMSEASKAMLEGYTAGFNLYLASSASANITNPAALALGGLEAVVGSGAVNGLAEECRSMPNAIADLGEALASEGQAGITPQELLGYAMTVVMRASGTNEQIMQLALLANPGEAGEFLFRTPFDQATTSKFDDATISYGKFEIDHGAMGSNGWGLGKDRTENGMGAVLANPHFPHTGPLRFYQSHLQLVNPNATGEDDKYLMNVTGGSLAGMPGIVNIGFNENVAWTHTVSTAEHFIAYALDITGDDRMSYVVDGQTKSIEKKELTVMVSMPNPLTGEIEAFPFTKDYFYSELGIMLETPVEVLGPDNSPFAWTASQAFTLKDMNAENMDIFDNWLSMNLASNLEEFQAGFKKYDGVSFVNTMYADKEGNAFYIDDSTVAWTDNLLTGELGSNPDITGLREQAGFTILPGNSEFYYPKGPMPYEFVPQAVSSTYVQNSNDSHWASAPDLLGEMQTQLESAQNVGLLGKSALYGTELTGLSLRTRMGLAMLNQDVFSGGDSKFNLTELAQAQLNNMSFLPILIGSELGAQCEAQVAAELTAMQAGATAGVMVNLAGSEEPVEVSLIDACVILGGYLQSNVSEVLGVLPPMANTDTRGAALFREFAYQFNQDEHLTIPFSVEALGQDSANIVNLPAGLTTDGSALQALAIAKLNLASVGHYAMSNGQGGYVTVPYEIAPDLLPGFTVDIPVAPTLGDVQFHQNVSPVPAVFGAPSVAGIAGAHYPWAGSTHREGGFNVYSTGFGGDDSLLPRFPLDLNTGTLDATYDAGTDVATGGSMRSGLSEQGYRITNGGSWMMVMQFTEAGPVGLGITTFGQSIHAASPHFEDQTAVYSAFPTGTLRPIIFNDADIAASAMSSKSISAPLN